MRLAVLACLLLVTTAKQPPKPNIRPSESSVSERNAQAETDSKQQELKSNHSVAIQECDNCTIIEQCPRCSDVQEPCAQGKQPDSYNPKHDTLYRTYLWFTIFGVVIALGGVGAIYYQTRATTEAARATRVSAEATQRSAEAAEKSVKLQENTQRQWLNLEHWVAFRSQPTDPLEVGFYVVNPTSLPLALHALIIKVNGKAADSDGPFTLITPSNPLIHSFGVQLDKEQETLYARGALSLDIHCVALFADSHGIHWSQEFGRMLLCGINTNAVVTDTKNTLHESGVPGERGSRDVELQK